MCIVNKFKMYKSIYCLFLHMLEMAECPIHYPNAYKNGVRCCKHDMDFDGGVISPESDSCKDDEFIEIYVNASLETCEGRDPKGLYKKARAGEIKGFTGIDAPYEAPESGELELDSDHYGIEELANQVIAYHETNGFLSV